MNEEEFAEKVETITGNLAKMLIDKNRSYGGAALDPVRVFSKASPVEQIRARIDDKLSRIFRGDDTYEEDNDIVDLMGYLVLLVIAETNRQDVFGRTKQPDSVIEDDLREKAKSRCRLPDTSFKQSDMFDIFKPGEYLD